MVTARSNNFLPICGVAQCEVDINHRFRIAIFYSEWWRGRRLAAADFLGSPNSQVRQCARSDDLGRVLNWTQLADQLRTRPRTPQLGGVVWIGLIRAGSFGKYALVYRQPGIPRPLVPGSVIVADILESGFLERDVGVGSP